jgi:hypothetical protein
MTVDRFNQLLAGPLFHPLPMFTTTRLALALKHVVDQTGEAGEKALEDWCADREEADMQPCPIHGDECPNDGEIP